MFSRADSQEIFPQVVFLNCGKIDKTLLSGYVSWWFVNHEILFQVLLPKGWQTWNNGVLAMFDNKVTGKKSLIPIATFPDYKERFFEGGKYIFLREKHCILFLLLNKDWQNRKSNLFTMSPTISPMNCFKHERERIKWNQKMKVNFNFDIVKFPECEIVETAHRSCRHFNEISKSNVFFICRAQRADF